MFYRRIDNPELAIKHLTKAYMLDPSQVEVRRRPGRAGRAPRRSTGHSGDISCAASPGFSISAARGG